jgi:hypothetical protein
MKLFVCLFEIFDSGNQRWCFLQETATDMWCAEEQISSSYRYQCQYVWKLSKTLLRGTSSWHECRPCKHLTRIITCRVLGVGTSHVALDLIGRMCVGCRTGYSVPCIGQQKPVMLGTHELQPLMNHPDFRIDHCSLRPLLSVAIGIRATSLTRFIENTCNICISK